MTKLTTNIKLLTQTMLLMVLLLGPSFLFSVVAFADSIQRPFWDSDLPIQQNLNNMKLYKNQKELQQQIEQLELQQWNNELQKDYSTDPFDYDP